MAKLVTLQILVDEDEEGNITDGLNEMLRSAATPVDPDDADARSWIVDWRLAWGDSGEMILPVPEEINDAICNGTYSEGDAFPGQSVPLLPGFDYTLIASSPTAMDSLWIKVPALRPPDEGGDLAVQVKRTHEGVIIDVRHGLDCDLMASVACEFSDAVSEAAPA
jgi:hypothetical protein